MARAIVSCLLAMLLFQASEAVAAPEKGLVIRAGDLMAQPFIDAAKSGPLTANQPVTILEALAYGLPVVATRVGAIPDTITSGVEGYLMQDDSAAELAAGVQTITQDCESYAGYSARARESFTARFTAGHFERAMAALLDGL